MVSEEFYLKFYNLSIQYFCVCNTESISVARWMVNFFINGQIKRMVRFKISIRQAWVLCVKLTQLLVRKFSKNHSQ